MTQRHSKVSIILVVTTEERELLLCLVSLFAAQKSALYPIEVIVADNNPHARLQSLLAKKFPQVKYTNTGGNIGFGPANNVGARIATGDYLFFLNSDTELEQGAIDALAEFLDTHKKAGVVAPTLYDMEGNRYPDQGSSELTPLTAIAAHSILHAIWPTNPVAHSYWLRGRDVSKEQQLAVVPGTALVVRRSVFQQIKGFDEQFFLYFEESDLCRRIRKAGFEVWMIPQSRVRHVWHAATRSSRYNRIFKESRYKYFHKYYGSFTANILEVVLNIGKIDLIELLFFFIVVAVLVFQILNRYGH